MRFNLTNQGVSLVNNSLSLPQTLTFVLGSGVNYQPTATDSGIHGVGVLTGTTSPVVITNGVPTYEININVSAFPAGVSFGEIGLFDGAALIALGTETQVITVAKGTLQIDCVLSQAAGSASVTTPRSALKIDYVDGPESLPNAKIAPSNVYIVRDRNFLLSTRGADTGYWEILGGVVVAKNTQIMPGPAAPTASTATVTAPSGVGLGQELYVAAKSGANKGSVRMARVDLNQFGLLSLSFNGTQAWSSPMVVGDLVDVYDDAPSASSFATLLTSAMFTGGTIDNMPIGQSTPKEARFTTLQVQTSANLGATKATSIDATPIGVSIQSSGAFTTLYSSGTFNAGENARVAGNFAVVGNSTLGQTVADSITATTVNLKGGSIEGTSIGTQNPSSVRALTLKVDTSMDIGGATVVAGTLQVSGATTFTGPVVLPSTLAINGGTINGATVGATSAATGRFTTLTVLNAATIGTNLTVGGTGSFTGALTANTFLSAAVSITGGDIDGTTVGQTFPAAGQFTTLKAGSIENTPIGVTLPSTAVFTGVTAQQVDVTTQLNMIGTTLTIPNGLNVGAGTLVLDNANQRVGINVPPATPLSYNLVIGGDIQFIAPAGAAIRSSLGLPVLGSNPAISETHVAAPYVNGKIVFKQGPAGLETGQFNASGFLKASPNAYYVYGSVTNSHETGSNEIATPVNVSSANNVLFSSDVNRSFSQAAAATGFNHYSAWTSGLEVYKVKGNGDVVNQTGVYATISDSKLKQQITAAPNFLAGLKLIQIVNYKLNSDVAIQAGGGATAKSMLGVIAQQLETVYPGLVFDVPDYVKTNTGQFDSNGNPIFVDTPTGTVTKAVKYSVFVPMLIKAVQEIAAKQDLVDTYVASITSAFSNVYARLDALDGTGPTSPPVFPF